MQIIPLPEGQFTVDDSKNFIPYDKEKDDLHNRARGSLLVAVTPFLAITAKDILLLDTGLGFIVDGEPQIYAHLRQHDIQPQQVTKVLLSHLHKDHAGGASSYAGANQYALNFPQAKYYVQRQGLEYAFSKGSPSYNMTALAPLQHNANVILLDDDGIIDGYIEYHTTSAHSPFHCVYWLKEANETVFFGGDDAPEAEQMKHKYVAKYDFDGRKAMQLRQLWWQRGRAEGWEFLFYHDNN